MNHLSTHKEKKHKSNPIFFLTVIDWLHIHKESTIIMYFSFYINYF